MNISFLTEVWRSTPR